MATVVFSSSIEGVSSDLTTANLVDDTDYTLQGVLRNTLAVVCFLYKRDAQSADTLLATDNSAPLSALQWSFSLPSQDGLFIARLMGFPIWAAASFPFHSCVYNSGAYYYCNNAGGTSQVPGVGVDWTVIPLASIPTVIDGLSPVSPNLSNTQTYNFTTPHLQTGILADEEATLGEKIINGICKNWAQAASVIMGGALLDSAYTNFAKQNYAVAQGIVDYLQAQTAMQI